MRNSTKPRIVLHIGYPKTGTKTLQNGLFEEIESISFLGKSLYSSQERQIMEGIRLHDSLEFCEEECKSYFQHILSEYDKLKSTILISDEEITTANVFNRRMADRRIVAERIKRILNPDTILIILRSQTTIIPSLYSTVSGTTPNTYSQYAFDKFLNREFKNKLNGIFTSLNYDKVIKLYEGVFDKANISVIPFELLVAEKIKYYRLICEAIGVPFNESYLNLIDRQDNQRPRLGTKFFTRIIFKYEEMRTRCIPWFKPSRILPFWDFRTVEGVFSRLGSQFHPKISDEWYQRIYDYYAEENTAVSVRYDLDLAKYNYPIKYDHERLKGMEEK